MGEQIEPSNGHLRIINMALELAKRSTHPQHCLGCVIVKGGVLSTGFNTGIWGKCAERKAIRPHADYRGAVLYVIRDNRRMSRPCHRCREIIQEAGIKSVIYYDYDGNLVKERV